MTDLPIALQLYTIRDALARDLAGSLDEVAAIGYGHVELADLHGKSPADWKALLGERNLTPIARHESWAHPDDRAAQAAETAREVGYDYAVQPWWPEGRRSREGYAEVAKIAAGAKASGVTLAYHNHEFEFDGGPRRSCRCSRAATSRASWTPAGPRWRGRDVPSLMQKLSGKLPLLHIKDCKDYAAKTLCEIGGGKVPIRDILAAAGPCGAKCLIVEQDNNWTGGDPLRSARVSHDRLREMVG